MLAACSWTTNTPALTPADRELLVPLDRDRLNDELANVRAGRSLAQERDERIERLRGALGVHRHAAVVLVAHPPESAESLRLAPGPIPHADALHCPCEHRAHSVAVRGRILLAVLR